MQHASTAVNVRALRKLIAFCGGQLEDPEPGDKGASNVECSYFLVGDRKGSRAKCSTGSTAETEMASNYLSLEDFLAVASGDNDGMHLSCSPSKRDCPGRASAAGNSKKSCR